MSLPVNEMRNAKLCLPGITGYDESSPIERMPIRRVPQKLQLRGSQRIRFADLGSGIVQLDLEVFVELDHQFGGAC